MSAVQNDRLHFYIQNYEALLELARQALNRRELHGATAFLHSAVDLAGTHLWGLLADQPADDLLAEITTSAFGQRQVQFPPAGQASRVVFLMEHIHETRGGGKTFFPLADQLRQHGYETAYCVLESSPASQTEQRIREAGIPIWIVPPAERPLERARKLRDLLRSNQTHVVFSFDMGDWLVGLLALAGGNVPVAIYTHFSDHLFSLGVHLLDCHLGLRPSTLLPCQQDKETALCRWLPVPGTDLILGESNRMSNREAVGLPTSGPVSITVTNLNKLANGTLYFEALDAVLQAHPALHHLLVGGGSPCWEDFVRLQVARMKASQRVHLLGPRKDVPHLLRLADVFVDSYPIGAYGSTIEAMQSGLPVVELMQDRLPIFSVVDALAEPRCLAASVADFQTLVGRLLTEPDFRRGLGDTLKRRFQNEFSRAAVVRRYAQFIPELIEEMRRQPTTTSSNQGRRYVGPVTLGNDRERAPTDYLLDALGVACRGSDWNARSRIARDLLQIQPRLLGRRRFWTGLLA